MKRILMIFATLLLVCSTATAQDTATVYRSVFGDSVTEWYLFNNRIEIGEFWWTQAFSIASDDSIVIDNKTYKKAVSTLTTNGDRTRYYTIYVRESENRDKLFARYLLSRDSSVTPEILLMDLSLSVGDTLSTANWDSLVEAVHIFRWGTIIPFNPTPTIRIDSIYYVDSVKYMVTNYYTVLSGLLYSDYDSSFMEYMRLIYPFNIDTLKFIEGIGPTMGVHYPTWPNNTLNNLLCCFKDTVRIYHKDKFERDSCILTQRRIGAIDNVNGNYVSVWPNPTTEKLTLSGLPDGGAVLTIFDFYGKPVIVTKPNVVGGLCEIDVATLTPGFYFIMLSDMKARPLKFIKL